MTPNDTTITTFGSLGLHASIVSIVEKLKLTIPTPIQAQAIPVALQGGDLIGIAQTGTGKTLAFGLPMLENLAKNKGRGLILLPTRELAIQVEESLRRIGSAMGVKTAVLIGGEPIGKQIRQLKMRPHVIVATPGRLIDHINSRTISLSDVKVLVLDEADRMLDMGFLPQITRVLESVPKDRQTMLFSATMSEDVTRIANGYMRTPLRIEIARSGTTNADISQELIVVRKDEKTKLVTELLKENEGSVLIFTRTKYGATRLCRDLVNAGFTTAEIHADRSLSQRRRALEGFKSGLYRILVATDIAARGIDVTGISLVINHDLPDNAEDYVHRIGRTGRAGRTGKAISFAMPDDSDLVRAIERVTKTSIARMNHGAIATVDLSGNSAPRRGRGGRPTGGAKRYDTPGTPKRFGSPSGAPKRFGSAPSGSAPKRFGAPAAGGAKRFDGPRDGKSRGPKRGPRSTRNDESPERFTPARMKPPVRSENISYGSGEFSFKTSL